MDRKTFEACIGNSTKILSCRQSRREQAITMATCEGDGWGSCNRCLNRTVCNETNVLDRLSWTICKNGNSVIMRYNCILPEAEIPVPSLPPTTTIGATIAGAILLILLVAILALIWRRRRSKKESGREVESAECSANARSVGLFINHAFQPGADYIIPATLPAGDGDYENPDDVRPVAGQSYVNCPALPGDCDYAQPDATGPPLQEAPGYQPLQIQTSNWAQPTGDAAYADYDVASSRQTVEESYVNCPKMPGDCDYAEPDATGPPLQEAPGYQPLQIQPSNDVAYAQYEVASSERNIDA